LAADRFRTRLEAQGSAAVIPCNSARARTIPHDPDHDKERHLVACCIDKIKHFRRTATRYEKTAPNLLAIIHRVAAMSWLR
jgi:transposase